VVSVIIESVPSGGDIISSRIITLSVFRDECMDDNGQIVCSWETIKEYLESGFLGGCWWDMTRDERYSITVMAITNTQKVYRHYREGKPYCGGGEGEFLDAACMGNTSMRMFQFGTKFIQHPEVIGVRNGSQCYKSSKEPSSVDIPESCYVIDKPYCLPFYSVSCVNVAEGIWHSLSSIWVVNDYSSFDNWIIFQYNECDIKPGGSWQLPIGSHVRFSRISYVDCEGYGHYPTDADFHV